MGAIVDAERTGWTVSSGAPAVTGAVDVSIVIPLYNEEENLGLLYEQLRDTLAAWAPTCEIILVDDGSTDRTGEKIEALAETDERVVAVSFPRNFGQTAAMSAGIAVSTGRVIVPMDGDLQNDPRDLPRLVAKLEEGYDVVSGWRQNRHDAWGRSFSSRVANAIISRVSGVKLRDFGCTLKAYRRTMLEGVHLYGEMHRFIPLYAAWQGARVTEMAVAHHPRSRGQSKYGYERVFKVTLDLVVIRFLNAVLSKPIYVFGGFSLVSFLLAFVSLIGAVVFKLIPPISPTVHGWHKDLVETPLPLFAVGFLGLGVQMMLIGLLAEMVMRTYYESQGKNAYVIKSIRSRRRGMSPPVA
jgi:glycosyltransferase involved in cell wall biosynthesis